MPYFSGQFLPKPVTFEGELRMELLQDEQEAKEGGASDEE